jgi:tRNA (guanine-N7-)-methyltransferase
VGIDIVRERVERALRKQRRGGLENHEFLHAEARLFLDALPPGVRIAQTFVLFPDPWPKVRHRKHRIMQSAFLARLAQRSDKEARVYFRTEFGPYFDAVCADLVADVNWAIVEEPWPFEFSTVFQSRAQTHQSLTLRRRAPNPPA